MTDNIDQLLAEFTDKLLTGDDEFMTDRTRTDAELAQLQGVVLRMTSHAQSLNTTAARRRIHSRIQSEWNRAHPSSSQSWRSRSRQRTRWAFSVALAAVAIAVVVIPMLKSSGGGMVGTALFDASSAGIVIGVALAAALAYYLLERRR